MYLAVANLSEYASGSMDVNICGVLNTSNGVYTACGVELILRVCENIDLGSSGIYFKFISHSFMCSPLDIGYNFESNLLYWRGVAYCVGDGLACIQIEGDVLYLGFVGSYEWYMLRSVVCISGGAVRALRGTTGKIRGFYNTEYSVFVRDMVMNGGLACL